MLSYDDENEDSLPIDAKLAAFNDYSLTPDVADTFDDNPATDEQKLTQAWINERNAPTLLSYQTDAIQNLRELLELQDQRLENLQAKEVADDLVASLCREEMERIKFVMRSYLRTRLEKIEKYCKYILSNPRERSKLSSHEKSYAERYLELVENHFRSSVLENLAENLQRLDDTAQGMSMVNSPDLNAAVFVKVQQDVGAIADGRTRVDDMKAGGIYIMRYATVKVLLEREQVVLL